MNLIERKKLEEPEDLRNEKISKTYCPLPHLSRQRGEFVPVDPKLCYTFLTCFVCGKHLEN